MRFLFIIYILCWSHIVTANDNLVTIGWIESVRILPEGIDLDAKIDTGADNSSIDVINWQSFIRKGEEWIRFEARSDNGQSQSFERPLERYTLIKRKATQSLKRPVVKMWLCIGKDKILAEVNLAQRENFKYRMLVGRSLLKDHFLINPAIKLTLSPACKI